MRVLLVEDDAVAGEAVEQGLKDAAYAVDWVRDGTTAIAILERRSYDIVLLDLGLPGRHGFDVLRSLRARGNVVALLVVTARRALEDRIQALDHGADDYLLKPVHMAELLARMRAVARRKGGSAGPLLSNGRLSLDPVTREAGCNGTRSRLSGREFSLLQALLIRPGAILSRADLEDRVYGWNEEVQSNAIEFLIHCLRKKLGNDVITNVRGVGWMVAREK